MCDFWKRSEESNTRTYRVDGINFLIIFYRIRGFKFQTVLKNNCGKIFFSIEN